jgi:GT2 family glycosyltransferase
MKEIGSDNEFPLVTVIVPVYNRAGLVAETIDSVLDQDYSNLECIILDDGSTDNSWEVIQRYKDRAVVGRHDNIGEARTVNKGFSMARGEIIGVVSSDDPLLPGAVKKIAAFFQKRPEIVVAYPDWKKIDARGRIIEEISTPDYNYEYMLRSFHCFLGPGTFFRAFAAKKLGGRDVRFKYVGDFDFWLRAGLIGPFARYPEKLATFRVHPGSTSVSNKGESMAREHLELAKKIYEFSGLPDELKKFRKETLCSAYFIVWLRCGNPFSLWRARYLLMSFFCHPKRCLSHFWIRVVRIAKKQGTR